MTEFRNGKYILDNKIIRLETNPARGGNISSIKYKGEELLFQPKGNNYKIPHTGDAFADFEAAGFDDAFPNIDPEEIMYDGRKIKYHDHGSIWTSCMTADPHDEIVTMRADKKCYSFKKDIRLAGNSVKLRYRIKNVSGNVLPCFYTMHCLFKCENDMRIVFPDGADRIENALDSERLGPKGSIHSFPITGSGEDLSRVRNADSGKYEKFYAYGDLPKGRCGMKFPERGLTVVIEWDKAILPYLGFWVTEGGFRGDYNCALEPSSGYYDSISNAIENNKLWLLNPGETKSFDILIRIEEDA